MKMRCPSVDDLLMRLHSREIHSQMSRAVARHSRPHLRILVWAQPHPQLVIANDHFLHCIIMGKGTNSVLCAPLDCGPLKSIPLAPISNGPGDEFSSSCSPVWILPLQPQPYSFCFTQPPLTVTQPLARRPVLVLPLSPED